MRPDAAVRTQADLCDTRGERYRRGLCPRCALAERLQSLLDDGTGNIAVPMRPLFEVLAGMPNRGQG